GAYATVIKQVNAAHAPVVAVDVPSGINTDTGAVMGVAVKADLTVTFAYNKTGLVTDQGQAYAGRVIVADDMGTY
ncbi:MAG: NAD(P)H-hydrate epimerase, partial [Limosilactobacillus fermentum]